ncbi:MAG: stage II sporulation protein P [Eubacteriales bacterium]
MNKYWRRYKNRILSVMLLLLVVMFCTIRSDVYAEKSIGQWNLETIEWVGEQMEYAFVPHLAVIKNEPNEMGVFALRATLSVVPVFQYYENMDKELEEVQDVASEAWILEAQAMDENYINEEGELVGEEIVIEENTEEYETTIDLEKIADVDYLLSNYYIVDKTVGIDYDLFDAVSWLEEDMSLEEDVEGPQILIYHTHSQEEFTDSIDGDLSTTIVGVGDYLTEILEEQYGVEVYHDRGVYDLVDGVLDRSNAYTLSGEAVEQILEENPTIEFVIDLHRDGVDQHTHLVTMIDGEATAQIMFFNGLSSTITEGSIDSLYNPYIEDNLALSFQMQVVAEELYPGFTRRIYLKSYRYNLHLMPKAMLIEAGAQTNSLEEMYNAMEVLAEILSEVLDL